jgi:diguanylate cyclase (GGDEF)-like protein
VARLQAEVARLRRELAVARHAAEHDSLTGLLNRYGFYARASEILAVPGGRVSVMMLDLDGFKPVNDTYGHDTGDRVLATVAARLVTHLGEGWWCARLGGDELAALRAAPPAPELAAAQAAELARVLATPMRIGGQVVRVGAAIGVVTAALPARLRELLSRADAAMYRAKWAGHPIVWDPHRDDDTSPVSRPVVRTRDVARAVVPAQPRPAPGSGHPPARHNRPVGVA